MWGFGTDAYAKRAAILGGSSDGQVIGCQAGGPGLSRLQLDMGHV